MKVHVLTIKIRIHSYKYIKHPLPLIKTSLARLPLHYVTLRYVTSRHVTLCHTVSLVPPRTYFPLENTSHTLGCNFLRKHRPDFLMHVAEEVHVREVTLTGTGSVLT